MMEWINIEDKLPEIPAGLPDYMSYVKCLAAWGPDETNVGEMRYEKRKIRNKYVTRFYWQGRICPWGITHWMYMPKPPQQIANMPIEK